MVWLCALSLLAACRAHGPVTPPPVPVDDPALDEALGTLSAEHRWEAEHGMTWLVRHPEAALPWVRALALGPSDQVSTGRAMRVLAHIGEPEDVELLARLLLTARDDDTVWQAANALGHDPLPAAAEALLEATTHRRREVAGSAAMALAARHEERARPALEALLQRARPMLRLYGVRALGVLGAAASLPALEELARGERNGDVRSELSAIGVLPEARREAPPDP